MHIKHKVPNQFQIEEFSEERFENNIENTRINPNIEIQHSTINDGDNKNIRIHCKVNLVRII